MSKLKKFDLMEKISRELESLHNTQQAVLETLGRIEVDNIELEDKLLESKVPDIFQHTAESSEDIEQLIASFKEKIEKFAEENNIEKLRQQEEANK
ncbi:MAG TPA: hypothetical protein VK102_03105 [Sphingobacterium sp.]|nr:hypothetical protein [Sphingobacterium sp.]